VIKKWSELIAHLAIDEKNITASDITTLKMWCKGNVSGEVEFDGSPSECHQKIKIYLSKYFDNLIQNLANGLSYFPSTTMNLLQIAALNGYDVFIENMLKDDRNTSNLVNMKTTNGMTALHFAAYNGHEKTVDVLLKSGANPALRTTLNCTPLHLSLTVTSGSDSALKERKIRIFNQLMSVAPETENIADKSGNTIAHLIAQNDYVSLMASLKESNSTLLREKNKFQRAPLHVALQNRRFETAEILSSMDELLDIEDEDGRKAIHYAARYGDSRLLGACAEKMQTIDDADHHKKTALHFAAESSDISAVMLLIEKGANVHAEDAKGFNVLHYAVLSENKDIVKWLIENTSIDINQRDKSGRTALFNLVINSTHAKHTEDLVNYLLEKGCDPQIQDHLKKTVVDYVNQSGRINSDTFSKIVGSDLPTLR
jgi:uncharacterized protein